MGRPRRFCIFAVLALSSGGASGLDTELLSVNLGGVAASGLSGAPRITADGRYVVFHSEAADLVATDTNGVNDVFVRDRLTGTTTLVSVNKDGDYTGNAQSSEPGISENGRYVSFQSDATDLVDIVDTNAGVDVFVRDLQTDTTILLSVNQAGTATGNDRSFYGWLSENGSWGILVSVASDLTLATDTNGLADVFLRDMNAGTTQLATLNLAGTDSGNGSSFASGMAPDGSLLLFTSQAGDLVANDGDCCSGPAQDIFIWDRQSETTSLVSVDPAGTSSGNRYSADAEMTPDGRYVMFYSEADNLLPTIVPTVFDQIFVRDLQAGTTSLVSINLAGDDGGNDVSSVSGGRSITPDGRYAVFSSSATDLVATTDNNSGSDLFVRDLQLDQTSLVSINSAATGTGNDSSRRPKISKNGRFVVFDSEATDLVAIPDNNSEADAMIRDLQTGSTELLSINLAGTGTGNDRTRDAGMSDNGIAIFLSQSTDLTPIQDNNGVDDVFAQPQPLIFSDLFETGDSSLWSRVVQ